MHIFVIHIRKCDGRETNRSLGIIAQPLPLGSCRSAAGRGKSGDSQPPRLRGRRRDTDHLTKSSYWDMFRFSWVIADQNKERRRAALKISKGIRIGKADPSLISCSRKSLHESTSLTTNRGTALRPHITQYQTTSPKHSSPS